MGTNTGLVAAVMSLPLFRADWVLWLLLGLSLVSVAVMIERTVFYWRHRVDAGALRQQLQTLLHAGDMAGAAAAMGRFDSLETNVVLFGLADYKMGAEAVEDLISGALQKEKERYDQRLILATLASNAPFIGLFGTVLGIIRAFKDLFGDMSQASNAVMAGIAEALIATAVGLLVAIPAVVAFNIFKGKVKLAVNNAHLLSKVLLSQLKATDY